MFKRAISIFVLIILLAHFAGFYVYFIVQLKQVRKEMRSKLQALPAEQLELIILTAQEYSKAKVEEHEIKVEGKMYDVSRVEEKDGSVLVYCLHDSAEDNLLVFIDKILKLPLKDKKAPSQIVKFTSLSFILPSNLYGIEFSDGQLKNSTPYHLFSFSFFPSLNCPPPRLLIVQ